MADTTDAVLVSSLRAGLNTSQIPETLYPTRAEVKTVEGASFQKGLINRIYSASVTTQKKEAVSSYLNTTLAAS